MTASSHSRPLLSGVAEVLAELAGDIEQMGETLCADPAVTSTHLDQLQGIDLVAQTARQLAHLLDSDSPADALADIRLEALRNRLHDLAYGPAQASAGTLAN
ncbi:hypothetical protein [Alteraurantiacibacter aquimixticola]|uniref:Uncharacterized protein n=1 Tax=Alteraurantiacibacter aquimixticola TaxID=2489173 RepID=A0A4T3EZS0_9SPHN|nr:hypothetical protein [Alteraurantiacibacter aquimixticola]TIX49074.1 hypothetical protein E5222_15205 [Alteraurantiacibacter aquimixticola]